MKRDSFAFILCLVSGLSLQQIASTAAALGSTKWAMFFLVSGFIMAGLAIAHAARLISNR